MKKKSTVLSAIKYSNPKISYIFSETLAFFIICGKCGSSNNTVFKEESTEILKILDLIHK